MSIPEQAKSVAKSAADYTTVGVIFGTWTEVLPHIAAFLGIAWMGIRVYESDTVQRLIGRQVRSREGD